MGLGSFVSAGLGLAAGIATGNPAIGLGVFGLSSSLFAQDAAERAAKKRAKATKKYAWKQHGLTVRGLEASEKRAIGKLDTQERLDKIMDRLQTVQMHRSATIATARQRTQGQIARVGGVGGSFSEVRGHASEIRSQVAMQIEQQQAQIAGRGEMRDLERTAIAEETKHAKEQSSLTASAAAAGAEAQATASVQQAQMQTVQAVTSFGIQIASNPAVAEAINNFFTPATPTSTAPVTTTT